MCIACGVVFFYVCRRNRMRRMKRRARRGPILASRSLIFAKGLSVWIAAIIEADRRLPAFERISGIFVKTDFFPRFRNPVEIWFFYKIFPSKMVKCPVEISNAKTLVKCHPYKYSQSQKKDQYVPVKRYHLSYQSCIWSCESKGLSRCSPAQIQIIIANIALRLLDIERKQRTDS